MANITNQNFTCIKQIYRGDQLIPKVAIWRRDCRHAAALDFK